MRVRFGFVFGLCLAVGVIAAPVLRADPPQRPAPPPPGVYDINAYPLTKIETLIDKPNAVIIKDIYRIETRLVFGMTVDAVVVSELGYESRRVQGLRVELHDGVRPTERVSTSWIDADEAMRLSNALEGMMDLSKKWTGREEQRSRDLRFSTVGGFVAGIHQTSRNQMGFVTSGFTDVIQRSVELADFWSLKSFVDQALTLLGTK